VNIYQSTRHNIPEDLNLEYNRTVHILRCDTRARAHKLPTYMQAEHDGYRFVNNSELFVLTKPFTHILKAMNYSNCQKMRHVY